MASAIRSAMARLGSRAGITAPPRMPLLRQAAARNLEGLHRYSNESSNSEVFLSTLARWSRETLKTVMEEDHYLYALTNFGLGIYTIYVVMTFGRFKPDAKDGGKKVLPQ